MSIVEKSDRERHRRDIHLCSPVSQPDATGFSGAQPDATETDPSTLSDDRSGTRTIPGNAVTPIGFVGRQAPGFKRTQS